MTLADELAQATTPVVMCRLCQFLASLPEAERAEWQRELRAPGPQTGKKYSNPAVAKVLGKRGLRISTDAVRSHRRNHEPE